MRTSSSSRRNARRAPPPRRPPRPPRPRPSRPPRPSPSPSRATPHASAGGGASPCPASARYVAARVPRLRSVPVSRCIRACGVAPAWWRSWISGFCFGWADAPVLPFGAETPAGGYPRRLFRDAQTRHFAREHHPGSPTSPVLLLSDPERSSGVCMHLADALWVRERVDCPYPAYSSGAKVCALGRRARFCWALWAAWRPPEPDTISESVASDLAHCIWNSRPTRNTFSRDVFLVWDLRAGGHCRCWHFHLSRVLGPSDASVCLWGTSRLV